MAIYRLAVESFAVAGRSIRSAVCNNLMSEQIEVDPVIGTSPLRTTENLSVEMTRCFEIVNGEGYVKRTKAHVSIIASDR